MKASLKPLALALLGTSLFATNAARADLFDERRAGFTLGVGVGGHVSMIEAEGNAPDDDSGGLSFSLSGGYGLNERTELVGAFHYAHHDDSDASRGIGLLGVGVHRRFDPRPDGWYAEALIGRAFVTEPFERGGADDLDGDDFAEGAGVRLAVGKGLTAHLGIEAALLGTDVDGGYLPAGEDLQASASQLQLTYRWY